ncbi:hypothetical protein MTO96_032405, partial [Rhipicephalus appendiculatus]
MPTDMSCKNECPSASRTWSPGLYADHPLVYRRETIIYTTETT